MNFLPFWSSEAIKLLPDSEVMHRIATGVKDINSFKPDYLINDLEISNEHILDFGCGAFRNTMGLLNLNDQTKVTSFDNPEMISRGKKLFPDYHTYETNGRAITESVWENLKPKKFDIIYASHVFQHISPETLKIYLFDMRYMTKKLVVSGRRVIDGNQANVWDLVLKDWSLTNNVDPSSFYYGHPEDHFSGLFTTTIPLPSY